MLWPTAGEAGAWTWPIDRSADWAEPAVRQVENSDVLPAAVAVFAWPTATDAGNETEKARLPAASVDTDPVPRNVVPWPLPDGSHDALAKKSSEKVALTALFSVP